MLRARSMMLRARSSGLQFLTFTAILHQIREPGDQEVLSPVSFRRLGVQPADKSPSKGSVLHGDLVGLVGPFLVRAGLSLAGPSRVRPRAQNYSGIKSVH